MIAKTIARKIVFPTITGLGLEKLLLLAGKNKIMKKKKFDAVQMMRDIRDKLTKRYLENPELEISDLQKIRRKYKIKTAKTHFA